MATQQTTPPFFGWADSCGTDTFLPEAEIEQMTHSFIVT